MNLWSCDFAVLQLVLQFSVNLVTANTHFLHDTMQRLLNNLVPPALLDARRSQPDANDAREPERLNSCPFFVLLRAT